MSVPTHKVKELRLQSCVKNFELSLLGCQPILGETSEQTMLVIRDVGTVQLKSYSLEFQGSTLRDEFLIMLAFNWQEC
jgi:hypothetical protein